MCSRSSVFGSMVFSNEVMRQRLPQEVFRSLQDARKYGKRLSREEADIVAAAMKDWALEKGATHYTHWFQPMTGITAEKHDAFLTPAGEGKAVEEFSGRELIHGEPDASSFPSGGLRATFEARGYTAWDPTSCAFVKDNVLCIPTVFASYGGEVLDKKTPLLRSMDALNIQTMRILKLFGKEGVGAVHATVGAEQEYFLIDREVFNRRKDLVYTGRTLMGTRPPKGQELDDHYFGAIKPRVAAFMADLDEELWKLGVTAKTEHNEAAPAQHELACVYTTANEAADQNQLVMECMKRIAARHGMVCLLHEKPFEGVNGSGKHDNWSLATDTGENLLNPGDTPAENAQFLLLLCAVLEAVDTYQALLRISVAGAGNDHRLGGDEAPPAILSVFLGEELTGILDALEKDEIYTPGEKVQFKVGVHVLPRFNKDTTDRNRTSPFAFTGNKFEFRMVGSSQSISEANIIINTAVADILRKYADRLEKAEDFAAELHSLIRETIRDHKRIVFNGNGYDEAWIKEAEDRGLINYRTTPEALPHLTDPENIALFVRNRVFSETELRARQQIMIGSYGKEVLIEAHAMLGMLRKDVLPAASRFAGDMARTWKEKKKLGLPCQYEKDVVEKISRLTCLVWDDVNALDAAEEKARTAEDAARVMNLCHEKIIPLMAELRKNTNAIETVTDRKYWPYPSCGDILFSVK